MRGSVTKVEYGREKGQNIHTFLIISWTILLNVFFFLSVMGAESKPADDAPYFTNEDVKKYRQPADDGNSAVKHDKAGDKGETAKKGESQKEQEYWCKKATSYRRKIEKNQEEVLNKEKVLTDLKESGGKKKRVPRRSSRNREGNSKSQNETLRTWKMMPTGGLSLQDGYAASLIGKW
ncbi:MAG TPA: hypothetical protein VMU21_04880 [Thermodesulfovibrionales bacterium]|nr:hypothetical protein [Thermodesulfovibrionales bacterium]